MRLRLNAVVLILISTFLVACSQEATPPPIPTDPWYRSVKALMTAAPEVAEKRDPNKEFVRLPSYLYRAVIAEHVAEAITALGDIPLLQLSTTEAERYAGSELNMPTELRPFLIHGLYRSKAEYTMYIADRALWVDSKDDPMDASEITRHPLVVFIDEVPPVVFVTTGESGSILTADP